MRERDFTPQKPKKPGNELRVNREIRVPEVRVVDEEGNMVGVMKTFDAIRKAEDLGLDLIEVAPNVSPPTCKIMDYGKYKYELKKKAHEAKKKQVQIVVKELQVRPRTDQHDLDVKIKHARRFLLDGDKVRFSLRFRGREMAHQELGMKVILKILDALKDLCVVEAPPKMEGQQLFALIGPDSVKVKEYKKIHGEQTGKDLPPLPKDDDSEDVDHE